jgi:ABC-type glycerol-3-phosphate transport system substrate-binding protein
VAVGEGIVDRREVDDCSDSPGGFVMNVRAVLTTAGLTLVVLAGAACGGGKEAAPSATPTRQIATPSGPVTISFWHVATGAVQDTLTRLTDQFNASQDRITVSLVFQGKYDDNMNKILASLGSGDLPALAQLDDPKTQLMADSGAAAPVQDFIDAEGYDLSDFLPQALDLWGPRTRSALRPVHAATHSYS